MIKLLITFISIFMSQTVFANELRDIKQPLDYPSSSNMWLFFLLALFLLTGAFFIYSILRKPKKTDLKVYPWDKAKVELNELISKKYLQHKNVSEFLFTLTSIFRKFLNNTFSLKALEMTTQELEVKIKNLKVYVLIPAGYFICAEDVNQLSNSLSDQYLKRFDRGVVLNAVSKFSNDNKRVSHYRLKNSSIDKREIKFNPEQIKVLVSILRQCDEIKYQNGSLSLEEGRKIVVNMVEVIDDISKTITSSYKIL